MSKTLANVSQKPSGRSLVSSDRLNRPFKLCFSRKLENGYALIDLEMKDLKKLHTFLQTYIGQPITEVDRACKRKTDKTDQAGGLNIVHYGISDSFRIHGYYEEEHFHVCRLDPNHRFHR